MNHQLIQKFCDFQVHSPRDPFYKEWPEDLMTLDGLYKWATSLLDECRKRGVHAVAVTDHHDLLAGLIALEVSRQKGVTDVWVFPGMEVTSKSGIQAILILDPTVVGMGPFQTKDKLGIQDQIKTAIGQSISAAANPGRVLQTQNWDELQKLDSVDPHQRAAVFRIPKTERVDRELDGEDQIADNLERIYPDKFLLLPNLEKNKQGVFGNESGRSFYMGGGGWFVGGIISGGQETDADAICGKKSQDYGTRVVTCIRSSDQRGKDANEWFSDYFGKPENGSWLKLSEPTTVSITQALISGRERRVFQKEVVTPADRIERFWIKGAQIFRDNSIDIDLTSHMNSFIGGRGSGKSLILSAMVRLFGADHDWIVRKRDEGAVLPAWEERHMSLFAKDGPFSLPEVEFGAEYRKGPGVRYRVVLMSPNLGSNCKYKLSVFTDGEWKIISDAVEVPDRLDFRPLVFLQGQMSALTGGNVDQDDLRKLIEGPIREERAKLRADLEILATVAKDGIDNSIRLRVLTAQFDSLQIQLTQKEEERKRFLAVAEAGLKEEERKLFGLADPLRDVIRNTAATPMPPSASAGV